MSDDEWKEVKPLSDEETDYVDRIPSKTTPIDPEMLRRLAIETNQKMEEITTLAYRIDTPAKLSEGGYHPRFKVADEDSGMKLQISLHFSKKGPEAVRLDLNTGQQPNLGMTWIEFIQSNMPANNAEDMGVNTGTRLEIRQHLDTQTTEEMRNYLATFPGASNLNMGTTYYFDKEGNAAKIIDVPEKSLRKGKESPIQTTNAGLKTLQVELEPEDVEPVERALSLLKKMLTMPANAIIKTG